MGRYHGHVAMVSSELFHWEHRSKPANRKTLLLPGLQKVAALGLSSSAVADSTFLRLSAIDIAGAIPRWIAEQFLSDSDPRNVTMDRHAAGQL